MPTTVLYLTTLSDGLYRGRSGVWIRGDALGDQPIAQVFEAFTSHGITIDACHRALLDHYPVVVTWTPDGFGRRIIRRLSVLKT